MKLIKPVPIWTDQIVSSSVDITEPEWDGSESYVADSEVMDGDYVYRAKVANTGKRPSLSPNEWGSVSAINRLKMFDFERGREVQTENEDEIVVVLAPGKFYSALCLFGLQARLVKVEVLLSDEVKATIQKSLVDTDGINTFFKWFKYPKVTRTVAVFTGIPYFKNAQLRVTISFPANTAKCGKIAIGFPWDSGCALFGSSSSLQDFSGVTRDAFGGLRLVRRRAIATMDYEVRVPIKLEAFVKSKVQSLAGTPAVVIGSERYEGTVLFGIARAFRLVYADQIFANYTLRVEDV